MHFDLHATQQTQGRLLAIGDVHGCLKALESLLAQLNPSRADQIVFLGDYIDRGPESAGVIEFLLDFSSQFPESVFLRGNHEQMFLDYLSGQSQDTFLFNGGQQTLISYQQRQMWPLPSSHRDFIESLPYFFETKHFIFVHAGLRPGLSLSQQAPLDLVWIRREFLCSGNDWGKTVVFGHTPFDEPFFDDAKIGLDTGCVYGRALTACNVVTKQIWQVPFSSA